MNVNHDIDEERARDSALGRKRTDEAAADKGSDLGRADTAATSPRFIAVSWVLVALWAAFIFFMSANTGSGLSNDLGFFSGIYRALKDMQTQLLGPDADAINSIAHFCEYAVFGALLANALRNHMPLRRACFIALACASAYGVTDEIHQLFVPERLCDPIDWVVDTLGGALGAGLFFAVARTRNVKGCSTVCQKDGRAR